MRSLLAAIAAGILFALSLPPYNLAPCGWFCFAPLLVAAIGRRSIESIGLGLLAALTAGFVQVGWHDDKRALFFAYYPFLLLAPLLAVIAEVASANRKRIDGVAWTALVATLGITCEYLTRFLPMPIHIALSQYRQPLLLQIASITGIWGVSFLMWWTNAAVADACLTCPRRVLTPPIAIAAAVVASTVAFGALRLHQAVRGPSIRVAAIQDYTGDETDGIAPPPKVGVNRDTMTRKARDAGAQFVVWSEECLGNAFSPAAPDDPTVALARKFGIYLVAGYSGSERPLPYNSACLITPDGRVAGIHHKIALYAEEKHTVRPGSTATSYATPIGRVGMEICFDTCNTWVTRRIAASGARLIAVPTYDPPVVHGIMHNLHATLIPFRAVENGVPMIRDDSNGTSEIIDAYGRILNAAPLYAPATVIHDVPLGTGAGTPFTRWGDWFAWACIAYFTVAACVARFAIRPSGASDIPEHTSFSVKSN